MRACTAVLVEICWDDSPDPDAPKYRGEVEFLTQKEWQDELVDLMGELTQQDGRAILSEPDPNAYNYTSWCKLYAVYGEKYTCSREATGDFKSKPQIFDRIPC
jgi:hypothetical protein